jgi:hypothetical protein
MAIDGIGKPPISGVATPLGGVDVSGVAPRTEFAIKSATQSEAPAAASPVESSLVGQLESGQLSHEQYLDIRADQAVHHLVGRLPAEQVDLIRTTLRERLSTDPLLISMARRATSLTGQR